MRIKSEKRVNFMENICALLFCITNGLQIGHYHTFFAKSTLHDWNFLLGKFYVLYRVRLNK